MYVCVGVCVYNVEPFSNRKHRLRWRVIKFGQCLVAADNQDKQENVVKAISKEFSEFGQDQKPSTPTCSYGLNFM